MFVMMIQRGQSIRAKIPYLVWGWGFQGQLPEGAKVKTVAWRVSEEGRMSARRGREGHQNLKWLSAP